MKEDSKLASREKPKKCEIPQPDDTLRQGEKEDGKGDLLIGSQREFILGTQRLSKVKIAARSLRSIAKSPHLSRVPSIRVPVRRRYRLDTRFTVLIMHENTTLRAFLLRFV